MGGHCKHSGDAQRHSGRSSIHIDPKRHPREDDDQEGRDVHLDQIVAHLALQMEFNFNTGEFTCSTCGKQKIQPQHQENYELYEI